MIYKSGIPSKRINIINDAKAVAKWFVQFIAKEKHKCPVGQVTYMRE